MHAPRPRGRPARIRSFTLAAAVSVVCVCAPPGAVAQSPSLTLGQADLDRFVAEQERMTTPTAVRARQRGETDPYPWHTPAPEAVSGTGTGPIDPPHAPPPQLAGMRAFQPPAKGFRAARVQLPLDFERLLLADRQGEIRIIGITREGLRADPEEEARTLGLLRTWTAGREVRLYPDRFQMSPEAREAYHVAVELDGEWRWLAALLLERGAVALRLESPMQPQVRQALGAAADLPRFQEPAAHGSPYRPLRIARRITARIDAVDVDQYQFRITAAGATRPLAAARPILPSAGTQSTQQQRKLLAALEGALLGQTTELLILEATAGQPEEVVVLLDGIDYAGYLIYRRFATQEGIYADYGMWLRDWPKR